MRGLLKLISWAIIPLASTSVIIDVNPEATTSPVLCSGYDDGTCTPSTTFSSISPVPSSRCETLSLTSTSFTSTTTFTLPAPPDTTTTIQGPPREPSSSAPSVPGYPAGSLSIPGSPSLSVSITQSTVSSVAISTSKGGIIMTGSFYDGTPSETSSELLPLAPCTVWNPPPPALTAVSSLSSVNAPIPTNCHTLSFTGSTHSQVSSSNLLHTPSSVTVQTIQTSTAVGTTTTTSSGTNPGYSSDSSSTGIDGAGNFVGSANKMQIGSAAGLLMMMAVPFVNM